MPTSSSAFAPSRILNVQHLPSLRRFSTANRKTTKGPTVVMSDSSSRMLHAVYRVGNLERTGAFLTALGMHQTRARDVPSEKYTNEFWAFGPESQGSHFALELTYNYGVTSYELGDGFGHFGVAVPNVATAAEEVKKAGFEIIREPGPVKGGTTNIAFARDPTGYKFELLELERVDPLCQISLRVGNLDESIKFYESLGMKLFRKIENESEKYTLAFLGFGDEESSGTGLELTYNWGVSEYKTGDGYAQIAVSTPDVYKLADEMREKGVNITREAGPVPGIGTKICAVRDPDGWKTVFVDAADFEKELVVV